MCRGGNAPRTAFATADPELNHRRSTASRLGERGGFIWLERCRANQNKKLRNAFELVGSRPRHRADTGAAAGFGGGGQPSCKAFGLTIAIRFRCGLHRTGWAPS